MHQEEMSKSARIGALAAVFFVAGVCVGRDLAARSPIAHGPKFRENAEGVALVIESPLEGERFITRETLRLKAKAKGGVRT